MEKKSTELEAGIGAVRKALRVCRRVRDRFLDGFALEKTDQSPVTVADFAAQAVITAALLKQFPGDAVLGEENADLLRKNRTIAGNVLSIVKEEWEGVSDTEWFDLIDYGRRPVDPMNRFWTLDPIDGTKGYLAGRQYAVALALMEKGRGVVGVLGCPGLKGASVLRDPGGCILFAVRDQGAWGSAIDAPEVKRIRRTAPVTVERARLCESVEPSHAAHETHARIRRYLGTSASAFRMDSQAKYGAVALGIADVYLRIPKKKDYVEKIWDHAAGALIVAEAGGTVSDISGKPLDFTQGETLKNNRGIVVTAGGLHVQVLSAVNKGIAPC